MVKKLDIEGLPREMIAMRAAKELEDGTYVNLGIGIPTLVSDWIIGRDIILQAEIGMLKTGPLAGIEDIDQDCINASCQGVTELPGVSYFDSAESLVMIRGGHIDVAVLGALQVAENGDYAGWSTPGRGFPKGVGNVGGSMDLAVGAKKVIITMTHTDNMGNPKILKKCTYPLTAKNVVKLIITDYAFIEVTPKGLLLREGLEGLTPEMIQSVTDAKLTVSPSYKAFEF